MWSLHSLRPVSLHFKCSPSFPFNLRPDSPAFLNVCCDDASQPGTMGISSHHSAPFFWVSPLHFFFFSIFYVVLLFSHWFLFLFLSWGSARTVPGLWSRSSGVLAPGLNTWLPFTCFLLWPWRPKQPRNSQRTSLTLTQRKLNKLNSSFQAHSVGV